MYTHACTRVHTHDGLQVEQLEARIAALSPAASRLPVLRAQHETLHASCQEVEGLEAKIAELKQVRARLLHCMLERCA